MQATEVARVRPALETAILLTSVLSLLLPTAASIVALTVLVFLWIAAKPQRQERVFVAGLTLAALLMLVSILASKAPQPAVDNWIQEVAEGFGDLWQDLEASAIQAAAVFEQPPTPGAGLLEAFHLLEEQIQKESSGITLFLIAPDGQPKAWAGEGLLHDPDPEDVDLPVSGFAYLRGYAATTVFAVAPIATNDEAPGQRPWRLIAGRSLAIDKMPFATSLVPLDGEVRWGLGTDSDQPIEGAIQLPSREHPASDGAPTVFLVRPEQVEGPIQRHAPLIRHLGVGLMGLTLLALILLRSAGGLLMSGDTKRPAPGLPLLAVAGAAALGAAAQFQWPLAVASAAAMGLATWGLVRRRVASIYLRGVAWRGAAAASLLFVAAYVYQRWTQPEDLASNLVGSGDSLALCLVWCLAALGLLTLAAPRYVSQSDDRFAWWATLVLLASGAANDFLWLSVPLLAVGGGMIAHWISGFEFGRRPGAVGGLLVLAALTASVSWETAYREVFRYQIEHVDLPRLTPPTDDERNDLLLAIYGHFEGKDFDHLVAPIEGDVDAEDLAFVLWRDSPLPHLDALSALAIETRDGQQSTFYFGLSLDKELELTQPPDRWNVPSTPEWKDSMILGQAVVRLAGRDWGLVNYWLLPRPGFRLGVSEISELEEALLRGGSRKKALDGLPRGVLYGLYDLTGGAITSPWGESPPLDSLFLESTLGEAPDAMPKGRWSSPTANFVADSIAAWKTDSVPTPAGRTWVWRREGPDGIEVLYLPQLTPRAGLERVGIHALASLVWVLAIAVLVLILALPWAVFGGLLRRTVRSYSKRMILVYTVLLLLPLIALNLVLLRSFADRQRRDQLTDARSALSSARLFLVDYLRSLEQGFDLNTQVNRELLEKISVVVEHPVNFYWETGLVASSQPELFAIGLLPKRIPGEVFSRLAISGYKVGFRQRRSDVGYLELYAPLDLPEAKELPLYLSVTLLEQEEDVAREVEALQRRAILVTSALVLLLLAVGSRLAQSFTKPIMELIGGTRRIAEGAPFLDVTPREHELEALADAIDTMARRLAEGRRQLVLEKQVVERIVANITSGVVSLDQKRRVLLQNQVAANLLGSEIGGEIGLSLAAEPRLLKVKSFLESVGDTSTQSTLDLRDAEGEKREWTLTWVPISGVEDPAALLVVDDATEVLRGQRLEAWAEMARIIAHEIKNPLTPIRLSAEHMRQVYRADRERFDEVFERCTTNILNQVEELADIASDFSIYSRIPRAVLTRGDLVGVLRELVDSYRDAARSGVAIRFAAKQPELETRFDPKLLVRAVRNVLENALRASDGRGEVELTIGTEAELARIQVADSGPGVDSDLLKGIFEPYFSTYESGTGLGLAITRRIIEEHGGLIEASNRASGGLTVTITIPLTHGDSTHGDLTRSDSNVGDPSSDTGSLDERHE